jgi:hypothetical protein
MRAQLLTALTSATNALVIKTASELPWNNAGEPLYLKNMKRLYLDETQVEQTELIPVLPGYQGVDQNTQTVLGYFAVDAKNPPAGLNTAITAILNAKNSIGIANFGVESDYTTEIQDDVLIYTVEYRLNTTA